MRIRQVFRFIDKVCVRRGLLSTTASLAATLLAAGAATSDGTKLYLEFDVDATPRDRIVSNPIPECELYTPERLGLRQATEGTLESMKSLHAAVVRRPIEPGSRPTKSFNDIKHVGLMKDIAVVNQLDSVDTKTWLYFYLVRFSNLKNPTDSAGKESIFTCTAPIGDGNKIPYFSPFVDKESVPIPRVKVFTTIHYGLPESPTRETTDEEPVLSATEVTALPPKPDASPEARTDTGPFPWTVEMPITDLVKGEFVLSLEEIDCSDNGHFFIYSTGGTLSAIESASSEPVSIVRERVFAANVYPNAGDTSERVGIDSSVDPEQYWCHPKRVVCYQEIDFGDFKLPLRRNRSASVPRDRLYNLRYGVVAALQRAVRDHCLMEPTTAEESK